ncbi:peptide-methionine (S)-S-oxide reductase [Halobacteriales archaeon QH_10_70_21]|nr:MAG: peptide-methionine (S)-S-oxide reductase [Halobacteriales archaeon QH_10_70_21]
MTETATFGGGCFWCIEAAFKQLDGVEAAVSGYAGGRTEDPGYKAVCSGNTGHAEVVQVEYDPDAVGYNELLEVFFTVHDPTQLNRQTELEPLERFYRAEETHQDYFEKNPSDAYCRMHAQPKVEKVREKFREKVEA